MDQQTVSLILFCASIALYTGLGGLMIGMFARSMRIMLGCALTAAALGGGIAAGLWAFGVIH